ncbi:neuroblast differentiation-associated protein AHNAK-like, partial [Clarias magur]
MDSQTDFMQDVQSGESEVIVKTVKEASVEGLVVTGGRKEGIFIKEVKLDSPASRELRVKEGDQILSATVYFDNVSYEDALQILEHAQPFKMEFCLRRKVEPSIPENAELIHPEEKDHGPPVMRSQRKMKKQQERISWPKFPSFGKGSRVQFNRSHSTSEAEEHRKLELSPPTSDNESPIKSPLKCPDGKDKKKKHKVEVKMKMRDHRSKSVEEHQTNENVNVQAEGILEEKVPEGHEKKIQDILQVLDGAGYEISTKTENEDPFQMERHEAHLISLGNTLKTTDISVALAEGGKRENSEMKVRVHEEGTPHIGVEKQAESFQGLYTISAPPAHDSDVLPEAVVEKFDNDLSTQGTGKDNSEKKVEFGHAELGMPILDICVGASKKSPRIGDEKQRRSGFQNESYGIRTRGPMADIATAKTHFVRTENGLQFISPDFSELMQVGKTELTDKEEIKTSTLPTERLILTDLDRISSSKFKLPKIENSGFVPDEEIKITEVEKITYLPKRDDIEIPGMENKEIKPSLQTPEIKLIKTEKMINMTKEREIQYHQIDEEFNVEDVKVAVSKFPCFKLPEGDITGVLVQREITIMEQKSEKSTPRGSPRKISTTSTDSCTSIPKSKVGEEKSPSTDIVNKETAFKVPKVELPSIDEQTSTALMKIDYTQLQITDYERFGDINFKLPKREDIEIPGMEAIKESKLQDTEIKTVSGADLDKAERPRTKKHSDKKSHDKKSKKPSQPENQSPSISTELQKRDPSKINTEETRIHEKHTFKIPKIGEVENIDAPVQEIKLLEDTVDKKDMPQKTETSKTKFKIPSITLPEFGTKVPRGAVDISAEDVQVKQVEIILPEDKFKLSDEPLISDLEDGQSVNVYGRAHDTETGQGTKFKLPKFEISFPEVKAPRIICTSKKDDDSSLSERESAEVPVVHPSKVELPEGKLDVSTDQTEINSEVTKVKIKRPGFSFPRFGIATSEHTIQEANVNLTNVDMSLPEGSIETQSPNAKIAISVKEGKQKDATKFKIPSIKFPNFGAKVTKAVAETSYVEPDVKGAQISLPDTEVKLPKETITIKDSDGEKEKISEFIYMDIQAETQRSKFKLPKFPEVKEPKIDISSDIDISMEKVNINSPDIEEQAGIHEVKVDLPFGMKIPKTAREIPDVDVEVKGPEISLPDAEIKLSAEPLSVDVKGPDANKQTKFVSMEMKDQDIQIKEQGTKFKLPHFGISLPEIKGPKIDVSSGKAEIDISGPKGKVEVHPPDVELQGVTAEVKADLPEVDSKDFEMKMKTPGFSFPKIGFDKSEVKAPEVDVSLPEGNLEIEKPTTDVTVSIEDAELKGRSKFGSPTKFKLPSLNFPKFGVKGPKASVEIPDVDVEVKGPEISLPDAEIKLSAEPLSVDAKSPDANKQTKSVSMEMKDQDIQIKDQGTKLKLPHFGISLPEIKGPKIDVSSSKAEIDISGPKGKVEVHPPDVELQGVTAEVKADLPEVDSKDFEIKMKPPGFSFPKIGFDESEVKALEADVSLPEGNLEIEKPTTDVTVSIEDAELKGRSKFGSPTKFKLPSLNFPKFGIKGPKASGEFPDVEADVKGPEIGLPDAEIKLSAEPLSVDVKGSDTNKQTKSVSMEIKDQDIQIKERGTKFKLPNFGISLPEIKGPKLDVSSGKAEIDISGPKGKVEVHPPDVEVQGVTAEVKADLPEMDSKDFEVKMKTPGFSFPKIGFDKSEVKAPEVDVSLPEGNLEIEKPTTDVTVSIENAELKGRSKFGSPTKFKLPSLNFPKFGVK